MADTGTGRYWRPKSYPRFKATIAALAILMKMLDTSAMSALECRTEGEGEGWRRTKSAQPKMIVVIEQVIGIANVGFRVVVGVSMVRTLFFGRKTGD